MTWEGLVLELQRQPTVVHKYSLAEFRNWRLNNQTAFHSDTSLFVEYDFLNYHQVATGAEVFVLLLDLGQGDKAYIAFDKKVTSEEEVIFTSSSFSPYAGLVTASGSATKIIEAYSILTTYLMSEKRKGEKLKIEIRLPPTQIYPRFEIDQWALWSLNYQITTGYLGRYINQLNLHVNRNRKRRLKALAIDLTNSKFLVSEKVEKEVFDLMVENRQSRHGVKLTHSLSDFEFLSRLSGGKFLKIWSLEHEGHICAAAIVFRDTEANILQYLGQSNCGYIMGSQDLVLSEIIEWSNAEDKPLLLGTSTRPETSHREINSGLDSYKSSWGTKVYCCYRFTLNY